MTRDIASKPRRPASPPTRWQENHGNLLLGLVAIMMVIGTCILIYQQHRFVPPRFPESEMIEPPASTTVAEVDDETANMVTIRVSGAISDEGSIRMAIYGSESDFNQTKNALASNSSLIIDGQSEWKIPRKQLPSKIAVGAYHDENSDDVLNRNRVGIPTERYGFSQNASGLTGPPGYGHSVIAPAADRTIEIFIR